MLIFLNLRAWARVWIYIVDLQSCDQDTYPMGLGESRLEIRFPTVLDLHYPRYTQSLVA